MDELQVVGTSPSRIDALDKVHGRVKYTNDFTMPGMLHGNLVTSPYAHAKIRSVHLEKALDADGVRAIVTGADFPYPVGPLLADRPPLAFEKVRYFGEPVAIVVADNEAAAKAAAKLVDIQYDPLPVVNSPGDARKCDAPLVHEKLSEYRPQILGVYPEPGTNVANHTKIRKGNMKTGWGKSEVVVEANYSFPQSDHAALETRCARAEISSDGYVTIYSASQGPFFIKKLLNQFFQVDIGKIIVHTAMVGGAFGGKGTVHLEFLAYLASRAVGGKLVNLVNTRENDLLASPGHIGLDARVKLGAKRDGELVAAEYTFFFDGGAYSDQGAGISKAAAVDCTGPYKIPHVWCDSFCMYTNHPYTTSFRGFGHPELTFVMERTLDMLGTKLGIDPLLLRLKNGISPGDTTPTGVLLNHSNVGNVTKCLERAAELIDWHAQAGIETPANLVRTKGICCIWKTSSTPPNAGSGAVLTFNEDGSINLNCAAVEIGQGAKTVLAQILAEKLKMKMEHIHVTMDVNTQYDPHQWKTVASSTTFLGGRAVIAAADDAIRQLKRTASIALQCLPDDLDVGGGRVYLKDAPEYGIEIKDIAFGYEYTNGHSVEGQIIGKGVYVVRHLTPLDKETGFGKPGPQWTVGAQAVEVEIDKRDCTYRIIRAVTVLDAGKVINPVLAKGQMRGGMFLGLSWASRESFLFDNEGKVQNPDFRSYRMMRFGEQPEYLVDFVETPLIDGPYGARGIGEYGVIGMAGALGNGLSRGAGVELNVFPFTPEQIWQQRGGDKK
jgi:CO/xanthine dehydrogenase Mo-binding subunit